jgi:hypothetical protein
MRIISFITDAGTVQKILDHLGEPTQVPKIAPARGPPLWEVAMASELAEKGQSGICRHRPYRSLSLIKVCLVTNFTSFATLGRLECWVWRVLIFRVGATNSCDGKGGGVKFLWFWG